MVVIPAGRQSFHSRETVLSCSGVIDLCGVNMKAEHFVPWFVCQHPHTHSHTQTNTHAYTHVHTTHFAIS